MAYATVSAPVATPLAPIELADFDHDFGHVVDEADLGFWSSDLEAGSDWDAPVRDRYFLSAEELEDVAGVYGEGEALFGYFDSLSTFDADDYEYQQSRYF